MARSDAAASSGRPKILLNIPHLASRPAPYLERLYEAGFDVVRNTTGRTYSENELITRLDGVYASMAAGESYSERVFSSAPSLKLVARMGAGYDKIDVAAATRHGVLVSTAPGANDATTAEGTVALMMAISCDVRRRDRLVREGSWLFEVKPGLNGATIGIVGLGRIGKAVARRCQGLGMRVIAYRRTPDLAEAARLGIEMVELDALMAQADVVSIHTPLSTQTRHMIDARRLALMKPTAYLVNTSRGGIVDESAMIDVLRKGRIGGAALDVFEVEPLPANSPLLQLDNVILAPHSAGLDEAAEHALARMCIDTILTVSQGRPPQIDILLNPEALSDPVKAGPGAAGQ